MLRANEFDIWWEVRRKSNIVHDGKRAADTPAADAPAALQMGRESVTLVLNEFVKSDYARQVCNHRNVEPTDYGEIAGMFETVRLVDSSRVKVKLKRIFEERNEALLDRVSRYIKVRIPQIKEIHAVHRDGVDVY